MKTLENGQRAVYMRLRSFDVLGISTVKRRGRFNKWLAGDFRQPSLKIQNDLPSDV